jgi:hypothetical protein
METVFSFVCDDGTNIHVNAGALRLWCIENKPEICWLPLNYDLMKIFKTDNTVSSERIVELSKRKDLDPIIMVKDGTIGSNGHPNAILVDGHHRYALACLRGQKYIEGYFLEEAQWRPFQIFGLRDVTAEDLRNSPVTKRDY